MAVKTRPLQDVVCQEVQKVQALYADATEIGRVPLKSGLENRKRELAPARGRQRALKPRGGKRIGGLLDLMEGNFKGAALAIALKPGHAVAAKQFARNILHRSSFVTIKGEKR